MRCTDYSPCHGTFHRPFTAEDQSDATPWTEKFQGSPAFYSPPLSTSKRSKSSLEHIPAVFLDSTLLRFKVVVGDQIIGTVMVVAVEGWVEDERTQCLQLRGADRYVCNEEWVR